MSDLLDRHDVLLADLDGTLYRGAVAVPGAVEAVGGRAARGVRTVSTSPTTPRGARPTSRRTSPSSASRPTDADVITSSQAAAAHARRAARAGAAVLVVGTDALAAEVTGVGLTP